MCCPYLRRERRRTVSIVIIIVLSSLLLFPKHTLAKSISPIFTRQVLTAGEIVNSSVSITNHKDYDLYVTPKVYKYYPKSEYITELKGFEELVLIDTDYIHIPANTSKSIRFQIMSPTALDIGTYYNLIVFQESLETNLDGTVIGTSGNLSHVVQLDLVSDSNLEKFTEDYSIDFRVNSKGIPFIKPARIDLIFFNNSKYTLVPKGEIRVMKNSMNQEPEYIKVNPGRMKVYPDDSLDMQFSLEKWYLEDIIFGKKTFLQLQNGIDNGITTIEMTIPGFRNELIYTLVGITITALLVKSIKKDTKAKRESSS